jgi:aryl-alcohol dehydrogenase-like predicted oxidoreductase
VALAWQMVQPGITAPIASATSLAQLSELVGATSLQLTPQDLAAAMSRSLLNA